MNSVKDLDIAQKTPIRVLHRRSLMTRPKIAYRLKAEWINKNYFILNIISSAGTYIKEFVHGDLGRTQPNIA